MNEHVIEWLGPYLDGELHGLRKQQVETHLVICAACRTELEGLRSLSEVLRAGPELPVLSTEKFAAHLTLNLPRRPETTSHPKAWSISWWLVPAGIMSVWITLQIFSSLIDTAALLQGTGLTGTAFGWLHLPSQTAWFSTTMSLFGGHLGASGKSALDFLNQADLLFENFAVQLGWQVALVVVYWAWMVIGWIHYRSPGHGDARPKLPPASSPS